MTRPVSIVVVSRDRPMWLGRCLRALNQLHHPQFEVIVVACPSGEAAARAVRIDGDSTILLFDRANISEARNLGIAKARGDVVAFIDDDAVPEPMWLWHLTEIFENPAVAQAGGITLGRNGISLQHAAAGVTPFGETVAMDARGSAPWEIPSQADQAPKLHGTNMAIRKSVLMQHDGFDPRYRFYLDETDLCMRIARAGGRTWHCPRAVVHHANAASSVRTGSRVPRDLFEVGASAAVFHQAHVPMPERPAAKAAFMEQRRAWLLSHMQTGTLTPDDVVIRLRSLEAGYRDGTERAPAAARRVTEETNLDAITQRTLSARDACLICGPLDRANAKKKAVQLANEGHRVSLFDLSDSAAYHKITYTKDGYWHHRGGIYGKEIRDEPLIQISTRQVRAQTSLARLERVRAPGEVLFDNLAQSDK